MAIRERQETEIEQNKIQVLLVKYVSRENDVRKIGSDDSPLLFILQLSRNSSLFSSPIYRNAGKRVNTYGTEQFAEIESCGSKSFFAWEGVQFGTKKNEDS